MKMSPHFLPLRLCAIICALSPILTCAQKIENINARVQGNQIIVEYDLRSVSEKDRYEISLFSSHNSYAAPLAMVQGDVGRNVYPGKKKIVWEARNELRAFNGTLTFDVRGNMLASMIALNPLAQVRRGKTSTISWKGGIPSESLKIDLLDQDGKLIEPIAATTNKGSFDWAVPADKKKGNYKIQITQQGEKSVADVKIAPKIPLLVKALPVVVIAAIIPFLGGGDPPPPPPPGALPAPPDAN